MNELTVFENKDFGQIRIFAKDGKNLFCGKDAAEVLSYKRPADAISAHCKGICEIPAPTAGGVQKMKHITEGDLYRLIAHSELPSAEKNLNPGCLTRYYRPFARQAAIRRGTTSRPCGRKP